LIIHPEIVVTQNEILAASIKNKPLEEINPLTSTNYIARVIILVSLLFLLYMGHVRRVCFLHLAASQRDLFSLCVTFSEVLQLDGAT
jgi:hypothetical protein